MRVKDDDLEVKVRSVRSMIQGVARNFGRDVYGPQGFPEHTPFESIEELGVRIGDAITREFVQQAVAQQAQQLEPQDHACPTCRGSTERRPLAPHLLTTQRGDGAAVLWRIWRECFSTYTPILDFIHAISYVYASALAGRSYSEGWEIYLRWAQWTWEGRVDLVIAELTARSAELGPPQKGDGETCPRRVVARALTYLTNHRDYMKYAEYRCQGLPITTSHMESTVKQVSRRVKGTEKFWSEPGLEALLQLAADERSDDKPLNEFWRTRASHQTGQRRNSRTRSSPYATAS